MTDLNEMTIAQLTTELNLATGKSLKKAKGSKESIIAKIMEARATTVEAEVNEEDSVYVSLYQTERVGEWRIYLSTGDKDRWLNMKDTEEEATKAGERAASRRGIKFEGTL